MVLAFEGDSTITNVLPMNLHPSQPQELYFLPYDHMQFQGTALDTTQTRLSAMLTHDHEMGLYKGFPTGVKT